MCILVRLLFLSFSPLCPSIARSLSLSLFPTALHIFLFFTVSLVRTHSFLSILFRHTSLYHSSFYSGDFQCVSSLSPSLFWIHFIYLSFALSFSFPLPTVGYLSTFAFSTLAFSISLPRKFVVSFPSLTPSLSLHLVGIRAVSLSLVYLPLRSPHSSLPPHAYICATRIPDESNMNARTHTTTYAHVRLMKSTNTSQYEYGRHTRSSKASVPCILSQI